MKKALIVVDYQKDFVDGALGFEKAVQLEQAICRKIEQAREQSEEILFTFDTHGDDYLQTQEGRNLPIEHCKKGSDGWQLYGNEGKIQSIRLERRRKMKKLLLILLTLLLCTGCAAKTAQENPNPADKKESITEEQPENTASLACRTVKGEAFSIALSLPDGWELKEQTPKRDAVLAQALLYCEGKEMAELSVEEYEPVSGVPPQEHYKVAYASLRLGSVAGWEFEPYQPVFAQDGVESVVATTYHKDPAQMSSGKSAAEVPYLEDIGVASFDQNKACYLTVSFAQDALTKEQAEEFAKEIRWESGQ